MKVLTVREIIKRAKLIADDIEEVVLGTSGYRSYDIKYAERELAYLRHEYIRLRLTSRGFPPAIKPNDSRHSSRIIQSANSTSA